MSKIETGTANVGPAVRTLREDELDAVTGGVIGGCIPNGPFGPWNPLPTYNPWLDPYSPQRHLGT